MRKNVVVFGGAGFLGGYVVNELEKRRYNITVVDIQKSKYLRPTTRFIQCDIMDKEAVKTAVPAKTDVVYNFAGFANLDSAIHAPLETTQLNVIGNLHILEAAIHANVSRFIYASSAYAMNNMGSFYGISKLASEKIIEEYYKRYGLKYTIVRYGSVYSERDFDNNYIYNLVQKAIKEQKIEHGGDGEEVREYIHAADAAKLSVQLIENEDFDNQHIILTGSEKMKRKELFEMIREILNQNIEIIYSGNGYNHHYKLSPYSFQPTASKKLIANPYIDMGQGILECIKEVYKNLP